MSTQDDILKDMGYELDQLNRDKILLESNLASAIDESYQLQMDRILFDVNFAQVASELQNVKQERDTLKYRLDKTTEDFEQLLKEKAAMQADLVRVSEELDQLTEIKGLLEGILARETNGLGQLSEEKSLLERNIAQVADGLEQQKREKEIHEASAIHLANVNGHLRDEMAMLENGLAASQTKHVDMQKEIARLQSLLEEAQDACRLTETAGADAAWRIVELQQRVAELEDCLNDSHPIISNVEDAVWERVRELEMALWQAHIDYNLLSQEIKCMRKGKSNATNQESRKSTQTKATVEGMGTPGLGETVEIAMKAAQPGFSMEYTNLKVSGCCNKPALPRCIEVCPKPSIPHTPEVVTPQRMIPIRIPSPPPELPEPAEAPAFVTTETERYFPSHGALRVRRGLGPASPTGQHNV